MREPLLWRAFAEAAGAHANAVAVVHGSESISYVALQERVRSAASQLSAATLVAVEAGNPVVTLSWIFGALRAGATAALVSSAASERSAQLRLLAPDVVIDTAGERAPAGPRSTRPGLPPGVVICTAGTTGDPKAVVHSHTTLGHAVRRLQLFRLESAGAPARVPADDDELTGDLLEAAAAPALGLRYATTLPLTTVAGLTVAFQALLAGETLVVPPFTDPETVLATLASTGATNVSFTPLLAQMVARALRRPSAPRPDQLLFAGIGGGPVAPRVPAELEAALGCPVAVGYGTTEAGGALSMGRIAESPEVRHATVGRTLPGVEVIVDPGTQELSVRCASTAVGYLTRSGVISALDRDLYATGDLARVRSDGAIELCGRADSLILRGGRNIDPVRIERVLEEHPAVARAAAFGVANPAVAGEQDVWSVVVLEHTVDEPALRAHCNEMLGASHTPRRVIAVDALPLTADGAVRRHELGQLVQHPTTSTR